MKIKVDVIIIGSGAGGATVARDLAKAGKDVLVIERGPFIERFGTIRSVTRCYDKCALRKSKEGVTVYRALMVGGTTVVSCGNGIVVLNRELKNLGIDLEEEFTETKEELKIKPLSNNLIGKGSKLIMDKGNKLDLEMEPMPKFINSERCVSCGMCVLGCKTGAKWSSIEFIKEMQQYGGKLITGLDVKSIVIHGGRAIGLIARSGQREVRVYAKKIILSAGGIGSPVILRRSGIKKAGNKLFVDLFNVTYGILRNNKINLCNEPTMAVVSRKFLEEKGFILSPFIDIPLVLRWISPKNVYFKGYKHMNLLGIMTKIKDDNEGLVMEDETFHKLPSVGDYEKLNTGAYLAKQILLEAGIKEKDIFTTKPRAAHPGGSNAIGEIVDTDLKTEIENLFVCDASVLPVSCGAPPIVTIVSLAKRLSKFLKNHG